MQIVPLNAIANQSFSIQLDNNLFDFHIKQTDGVMSISIAVNTVQIISNLRAVAGYKLFPSLYEETGNFIFITQNFELPDYTKFGTTQTLVYASQAELSAIRAPQPPPITKNSFNPIAALPLRFAPQGYT